MAASSTNKKVVVVRFDREPLAGVTNPAALNDSAGLEILTATGTLARATFDEIKAVCFCKRAAGARCVAAEPVLRCAPKSGGLWLRFRFRDQDGLDGVVPNNLLTPSSGFTVVPPILHF